jgi:FkbM family methyltransferase
MNTFKKLVKSVLTESRRDLIHFHLDKIGLRICNSRTYRHSLCPDIYNISEGDTVFDIGANIGQTALQMARSFPGASIHAFEPVPSVYRRLSNNTHGSPSIQTHNLALGSTEQTVKIRKIESDSIQTTRVLDSSGNDLDDYDTVKVSTVDSFCESNGIKRIALLKTDTEGFDLDVLRGASASLADGKIDYILSEACFDRRDKQHTCIFDIIEFLEPLGYELVSVFDLSQHSNGKLHYMNALFAKKILSDI